MSAAKAAFPSKTGGKPGSILAAAIALVLCVSGAAWAGAPPSAPRAAHTPTNPRNLADLIEGAAAYDNRQITVEGEVIGEVMLRGDETWANIYDGSFTIGIWGPAALFDDIKFTGRYQKRGDRVRATGVFQRADPKQGGELDIHLSSLAVVARGESVRHRVTPGRVKRTIICLAGAIFLGLFRLLRPHPAKPGESHA